MSETVELVVGGARLPVLREDGFELFERNLALLDRGRTEPAEVPLQEHPASVLHLVLGSQAIALIEQADAAVAPVDASSSPRDDTARSATPSADEVFPDFDAYLQ